VGLIEEEQPAGGGEAEELLFVPWPGVKSRDDAVAGGELIEDDEGALRGEGVHEQGHDRLILFAPLIGPEGLRPVMAWTPSAKTSSATDRMPWPGNSGVNRRTTCQFAACGSGMAFTRG
jgi:hypothetical protein